MKNILPFRANTIVAVSLLIAIAGCKSKAKPSAAGAIDAINLKRGELIVCGPANQKFGTVDFATTCSGKAKKDFDLGVALLHSFEYDEAEKVFAKVIDAEPQCAMAYWGVAMSNYHPLWSPPTPSEFEKGSKAIAIAESLPQPSKRESDYISAIATFYKDWQTVDHATRCKNFEKAMEKIYKDYPDDKEAAVFYALALDGSADPTDKTFSNQRKAGDILNALYPGQPDHPGIIHYIIHSYDYPELAEQALPAARKYALVAPSSAHAQHMPSHIFTRLGLWDDDIKSNRVSAESAKCYAQSSGIKGHWDEELHALDYLEYSYLQKGDMVKAIELNKYLKTIQEVNPTNFKVAYAFAAMPARFALENRLWKEAATLEVNLPNSNWDKYPWQNAIIHFARALGNAHEGAIDKAMNELNTLKKLRDELAGQKDTYKANQVQVQIDAAEAWILFKKGKNDKALASMTKAVDAEESTQKHPVTPGEVLPARELLGDMYLAMNQPAKALESYVIDLKNHPNRFNGLYNAGLAAERANMPDKANQYYKQLVAIADPASMRAELTTAKMFLTSNKAIAK